MPADRRRFGGRDDEAGKLRKQETGRLHHGAASLLEDSTPAAGEPRDDTGTVPQHTLPECHQLQVHQQCGGDFGTGIGQVRFYSMQRAFIMSGSLFSRWCH